MQRIVTTLTLFRSHYIQIQLSVSGNIHAPCHNGDELQYSCWYLQGDASGNLGVAQSVVMQYLIIHIFYQGNLINEIGISLICIALILRLTALYNFFGSIFCYKIQLYYLLLIDCLLWSDKYKRVFLYLYLQHINILSINS